MSDRAEALRRELQFDKTTARFILEAVDAGDKAAGIYRVSLDAAVEAAAKARCRAMAGVAETWDWDTCLDQDRHREHVRPLVTAAVMGGAQ